MYLSHSKSIFDACNFGHTHTHAWEFVMSHVRFLLFMFFLHVAFNQLKLSFLFSAAHLQENLFVLGCRVVWIPGIPLWPVLNTSPPIVVPQPGPGPQTTGWKPFVEMFPFPGLGRMDSRPSEGVEGHQQFRRGRSPGGKVIVNCLTRENPKNPWFGVCLSFLGGSFPSIFWKQYVKDIQTTRLQT